MKLTILIIITCLLLAICIGQRIQVVTQQGIIYSYENTIDILQALNLEQRARIPSPCDIQQMLLDAGYDIGPKGVDGMIETKTKTAWDRAICDQYAAKFNHYYED